MVNQAEPRLGLRQSLNKAGLPNMRFKRIDMKLAWLIYTNPALPKKNEFTKIGLNQKHQIESFLINYTLG